MDAAFSVYDEWGTRRVVIGEILRFNDAAQAALNALGEGTSPKIDREVMGDLMRRIPDSLNHLAGIKMATGPTHATALRDRIAILWLLYDACWQAEVAPRRIKIEQRMRAVAETTERSIRLLGQLAPLFREGAPIFDDTETAYGLRRDPLRFSAQDIDLVRDCLRLLSPEMTPTYCKVLGMPPRIESASLEIRDVDRAEAIALTEAGKHSALGIIATIIPAIVGPRQDAWVAQLARAAFSDSTIDARLVGRRRQIFLEQRGLLLS
jgi:hypothetical protein